jgi:hypothetical protein
MLVFEDSQLGCIRVGCARASVVAVKVEHELFAAAPSSRAILVAGREESMGTSKPRVVEKKVCQIAGPQASSVGGGGSEGREPGVRHSGNGGA